MGRGLHSPICSIIASIESPPTNPKANVLLSGLICFLPLTHLTCKMLMALRAKQTSHIFLSFVSFRRLPLSNLY